LALRGLEDSVRSLITGDTKLAYTAILRDSRVDDLESLIDGMCVEFIVRHIPVATHLRFVHSVAKIVSVLERVGDYAESINRQAILLSHREKDFNFDDFEQLAGVAVEMTRQAVRSFLDGDVTLARRTIELDAGPREPDLRPPVLSPGPAEATYLREPFTAADLDIDDEFRQWAMDAHDEMLPGLGAVPACLGVFRARQQDCYTPAEPLYPANVARLGATLARMRQRPGIERALAEGWLDMGEPRGLAFVLEPLQGEGWWCATRPFSRRAGPIGEWSGPWRQQEGVGPAELPPGLRPLRWPLPAALPFETGEPRVMAVPDTEVAMGTLAAGQVLPTTAEDWAALAASPFERDVLAEKGEHAPRVIVFRGRDWERWNLDGPLPTDLDDMVRNICRRGGDPDAVVVVQFAIVPLEGGSFGKCLLARAEHRGERHTRAMEIVADSAGKPSRIRYLRLAGEDEAGWIGVAPLTELTTESAAAEPDN